MKEARQHRFTPPKGAADLLLIRHGETQAAVRGESFPMVDGQAIRRCAKRGIRRRLRLWSG